MRVYWTKQKIGFVENICIEAWTPKKDYNYTEED